MVNKPDMPPSHPSVSSGSASLGRVERAPESGAAGGDDVRVRADEDAELVRRCQSGDRAAFQAIVKKYERRVYGIAFGFVRNREDSLDLTQDAFVKVFRNLGSFQGTSSFYTWLYRVATNVCIDHVRRKKRRKEGAEYDDTLAHSEAAMGDTPLISTTSGISPARAASNKELGQKIKDALATLSEAHREILLLREIEGLSYEELSEVLDIPKGTVMSRLFHARTNLQKALVDYLEE